VTFLHRLTGLVRPRRSADPAALATFIARWGAFAAQKTVLDYCAVKLGVNWNKALEEPEFATLLRDCRWRVYLAAQGDVAAVAEARLRPFAADREADLAEALAAMAAAAVVAAGPPPHLGAEAEAACAGYRPRLARCQLAPPQPPTTLPLDAGPVLLETIPIHPELRRGEQVSILGALRLHLVAADQEMERRFDPAPLLAALLGGQPGA
jgi:hypothetical protein